MPVTASQMTTKAAIKLNNRINSAGICSPGRTKLPVVLFMIFFAMRRFFLQEEFHMQTSRAHLRLRALCEATQKITKRADIYHAAGNIIWTDFLKSQGVRLRLVCELPGFATKNCIAPLMKSAVKETAMIDLQHASTYYRVP